MNHLEKINAILEDKFVFVDEMVRILALAFTGNKNAIIYGPGGHAKSDMTSTVIDGLGLKKKTFYQFFGEGMDEARLFGGLNFQKLEKEKVLEYFPEKSFLNSEVAVFEELFDAPSNVLLSLKDTLTAKELRNGSQRFKMKTKLIIVLTNKEPHEISELGPEAHALIERFPLQLNLKWKSYSARNYLAMFEKIASRLEGPILNGYKSILAEILAKATADGKFVSPRTAVHAYEICQTSAKMRGADEVSTADMVDLKFLPGLESLGESLQRDLVNAMERAQAEKDLYKFESEHKALLEKCISKDALVLLKLSKSFQSLYDELSNLRVPDSFVNRKSSLGEAIIHQVTRSQAMAMSLV